VSGIARRRTEQAGAPLSWTSERADTFFVCEASEEGSGLRAPASASEASNLHGVGGGVLSSASDNNGGKSTAPKIARRCPGRTNEQTRFRLGVREEGRGYGARSARAKRAIRNCASSSQKGTLQSLR
jgi:hypothetical protein